MAHTYTAAFSVNRIDFIVMQFILALQKIFGEDISESSLNDIREGLSRGWIKGITISALDDQGLCHAQMLLDVDWQEYSRQITGGNVKIFLSRPPENGLHSSTEVKELTRAFKSYIDRYNLKPEYRVPLTDEINGNSQLRKQVMAALHLVDRSYILWRSSPEEDDLGTVDELSELHLKLRLRRFNT